MRKPGPIPQPGSGDLRAWAGAMVMFLSKFFASLMTDTVFEGRMTTRAGRCRNMTLVTIASYTIKLTDEVVDVNYAGAVSLTLPATAAFGQELMVQDSSGAAASNNITINKSSDHNVNGGASVVLSTNDGRRTI